MKTNAQPIVLLLLVLITLAACRDQGLSPGLGLGQGTPPTPTHQRIALLAMLANVNYDLIAGSQAELSQNTRRIQAALQTNTAVRAYLGTDWQVVWGPAIANSRRNSSTSAPDSFVTDNTMYVARGTDLATGKPLHVVAIAGTNAVSRKGAIWEDFNVFSEKEWGTQTDWGKPGRGKISAGSALGLSILNAMRDPATGQTLLAFLATLKGAGPADIAFTGHSLGGALCPLMALQCREWQAQTGAQNINVSVYPIAGPTPGDGTFAQYAAQTFGENYHSVINAHDVVPHAWQKDLFAQIPALYKNSPPFNPGGSTGLSLSLGDQLKFEAVKLLIELKSYQRIAPEREYVFPGSPNVYPGGAGSFFAEAKYQHVLAYYKDAFGFPPSIIAVLDT